MQVTAATTGTIVFTDIVGFTQLTDEHGDDLALSLLERQERVVRNALAECGRVMKELGDGLMLWFDSARDAVVVCLRMQLAFEQDGGEEIPLWVRMGLHWGCPRRRGDDIVGHDVNLAARIAELAGPGEVLCSEATAEAAGAIQGVEYESLGPVFVRGISEAVPIVRAVQVVPAI
jgi:class 3 adenylate cyclase